MFFLLVFINWKYMFFYFNYLNSVEKNIGCGLPGYKEQQGTIGMSPRMWIILLTRGFSFLDQLETFTFESKYTNPTHPILTSVTRPRDVWYFPVLPFHWSPFRSRHVLWILLRWAEYRVLNYLPTYFSDYKCGQTDRRIDKQTDRQF